MPKISLISWEKVWTNQGVILDTNIRFWQSGLGCNLRVWASKIAPKRQQQYFWGTASPLFLARLVCDLWIKLDGWDAISGESPADGFAVRDTIQLLLLLISICFICISLIEKKCIFVRNNIAPFAWEGLRGSLPLWKFKRLVLFFIWELCNWHIFEYLYTRYGKVCTT